MTADEPEEEWIEPEPDRYQEWRDQELSTNWDAERGRTPRAPRKGTTIDEARVKLSWKKPWMMLQEELGRQGNQVILTARN